MSNPEIHEIEYPFIWSEDEHSLLDCYNPWSPGLRWVQTSIDDSEQMADGLGLMIFEVVSRHKPGKYPERVFYTRKWKDPEGNVFGKPQLRITTSQNFRRLCRGFRYPFTFSGITTNSIERD